MMGKMFCRVRLLQEIRKSLFILIILPLMLVNCKKEESVELKMFSYRPELTTVFNQVIEQFTTENPNIKIEIEYVRNDAFNIIKTKLDNNQAPDIIMLSSYRWVQEIAKKNQLKVLSEKKIIENIPSNLLRGLSYDKMIYGFPFSVNTFGIIYNRSIFDKYNIEIPQTIEQLRNVCSVLNNKGITPFAVAMKDKWALGSIFHNAHSILLGEYSERWLDGMNLGISSFSGTRLNILSDFFSLYKNNSGNNPTESDYQKQIADFSSGKAAMMIQSFQAYNTVNNINPEILCGFFPIPFTDRISDYKAFTDVETVLSINAAVSPAKEKAILKFFNFLMSENSQLKFSSDAKVVMPLNNSPMRHKDRVNSDLAKFIRENKVSGWTFREWPVGVSESSKDKMFEHIAGKKSMNEIFLELDQIWSRQLK